MTKLSIFDKIEESTIASDKIEHFWKIEKAKKKKGLTEMTKLSIFDKIEEAKKIHGPLRKWQNWAFLTKLKKRKKYTSLSQNDKMGHFWQK